MSDRGLRIGEVARLTGTTTRTIRYYEEIGLLPAAPQRPAGSHRLYGEAEVARLREILRLKELLGVSLDELREVLEAETARAALRDEWRSGGVGDDRRREILGEALEHVDRQLALVERRREEIASLEAELRAKRERLLARLGERGAPLGT
ncbi:MAG: MerR family transcriptional regulator [Solirubrobacteraceae bacterium]